MTAFWVFCVFHLIYWELDSVYLTNGAKAPCKFTFELHWYSSEIQIPNLPDGLQKLLKSLVSYS